MFSSGGILGCDAV